MVSNMRDAKLRITGDSKGAVGSLQRLNKEVLGTSRGIKLMKSTIAGAGGFALGRLVGEAVTVGAQVDKAIRLVGSHLGLTGDEFTHLSDVMGNLAEQAQFLGVSNEEFGQVLVDNAIRASLLRGKMAPVEAIATILAHSLLAAKTQNIGFGESTDAVIRILKAYGFTADDATTVTDQLTVTFQKTGKAITDLTGPLEQLGPKATAAAGAFQQSIGSMFEDILSIIGTVGPQAGTAVEAVLEIATASLEGDENARSLFETVGLTLNEDGGGLPPLLQVFGSLKTAIDGGVLSLDEMKKRFSPFISDEEANRIKEVADNLGKIAALKGGIRESDGATEKVATENVPLHGVDRFLATRQNILDKMNTDGSILKRVPAEVVADVVAGVSTPILEIMDLFAMFKGAAIPGAAHGGIVRATPGGQIVRVGEGGQDEAIIPLSQGMKNLGRGGGITINGPINLPGVRNANDFVRQLRALEFEATYGKLGAKKGGR